jgi:Family of unknown function (DUF6166)
MVHKITWRGERRPFADKHKVTMQFEGSELLGNLPLYLDEINHSPTGFEWGYYGSGPSQLSYAILRSYYVLSKKLSIPEAIRKAQKNSFQFKEAFVSKWHGEEWEITSDEITYWLTTIKEVETEGWV